jgi:hypothetical protein
LLERIDEAYAFDPNLLTPAQQFVDWKTECFSNDIIWSAIPKYRNKLKYWEKSG